MNENDNSKHLWHKLEGMIGCVCDPTETECLELKIARLRCRWPLPRFWQELGTLKILDLKHSLQPLFSSSCIKMLCHFPDILGHSSRHISSQSDGRLCRVGLAVSGGNSASKVSYSISWPQQAACAHQSTSALHVAWCPRLHPSAAGAELEVGLQI